MKRLIHFIKKVRTPYEIKGIWLSREIPEKTKYGGLIIRLKEYPREGDVVELFRDMEKRYFYKTTSVYGYSNSAFPDYAYWDNGMNYDFEFDHVEATKKQ